MVKVIYGEEPYLIDHTKNQFLKGADVVNMYSEWDENIDFSSSMLWNKVVFVFKCSFPTKSEVLKKLISSEQDDVVILFLPGVTVDKRTSMVKEMDKNNCLINCKKFAVDRVRKFLRGILGTVDDETLSYLINRVGYYEDESINLYSLEIVAKKLVFFEEKITRSLIEREVSENITSKAYELFGFLIRKNMEKYFSVYEELSKDENTIAILSNLLRAVRIGYKAKLLSSPNASKEIGVLPIALQDSQKLPKDILLDLCDTFQEGVNLIKSGVSEKDAFTRASLKAFDVI